MISIVKTTGAHTPLLAEIAERSFLESHGHSASAEDITNYVTENYQETILQKELADPANIYHLLYHNNKAAGYSKILFNSPCPNSVIQNIAKLERLYLLKEFYHTNLGQQLFEFNIKLAKENDQSAIWLYVWKENERAIRFYTKNGFIITGSHDFKIAENHFNPNHQMFLSFY